MIIDPHIHMVSRTTADYQTLALSGVVAVSEPAFWAGFDRSPAGFIDYYEHLTTFEPKRAAQFGVDHYCWICLNPKEAEDLAKAREVLAEMPKYLTRPTVLGVGEIGLNKNTANESKVFRDHVQMAIDTFTPKAGAGTPHRKGDHHLILIHTPHLEDKLKGTRMILDMLREYDSVIDPRRVLIDHVEEHTVKLVLDQGYWAGMTIYPISKCTPERAVDILEMYGTEKLCVNAAADWGVSDPLNTHRTRWEAHRRGHSLDTLMTVFYNNPARFFGQSPNFKLKPMKLVETP